MNKGGLFVWFHGEGEAEEAAGSTWSQGDPLPDAGGTRAAGRQKDIPQYLHPRLPLPLAANLCLTGKSCSNLHSAPVPKSPT